jgi:hypothetical protein
MNAGFDADNEYAFYRNIKEEGEDLFPFSSFISSITPTLLAGFGITSIDEVRLDDAFCIHYDGSYADTTCAKHQDPSDITVNFCLTASDDMKGSEVKFYGRMRLDNIEQEEEEQQQQQLDGSEEEEKKKQEELVEEKRGGGEEEVFYVKQTSGKVLVHFGAHPHETMPLTAGKRTNVIMTFVYKDKSKSGASRTCYATGAS